MLEVLGDHRLVLIEKIYHCALPHLVREFLLFTEATSLRVLVRCTCILEAGIGLLQMRFQEAFCSHTLGMSGLMRSTRFAGFSVVDGGLTRV